MSLLVGMAWMLGLGISTAGAQTTFYSLDFQGGTTDYTGNFRALYTTAQTNALNYPVTASGGAGNLSLRIATSYSGNGSVVFDTTPADSSVKNTFSTSAGLDVHFQVSLGGTGASSANSPSIGVLFINPTTETSSQMALVNFDSDTSDRIRFFGGNPNGSNSGADAQGGTTTTGDGGASYTTNSITNVDVKYAISGTSALLTMTVGSLTSTYTFASGTSLSNVEIGLRLYDAVNGTAYATIDNFTISSIAAIPEPSTTALMILGVLLLAGLAYRRKQGFTAAAEVH
ncbi:PEP-CTERM sorting domain-containing protein [Verrucomicrobium sp. GAS474]|uniref:PEP-CTERM sorting domain-containing protein n=1 Tax=Verrucomicrobium sp. GAS474 TaxID=1882831 RepID=UPI0012FF9A48|nr:PEP-CTERM sorting domain-containing protein [Verrucomicrobium sp. GAS474]